MMDPKSFTAEDIATDPHVHAAIARFAHATVQTVAGMTFGPRGEDDQYANHCGHCIVAALIATEYPHRPIADFPNIAGVLEALHHATEDELDGFVTLMTANDLGTFADDAALRRVLLGPE